MFLSVLQGQSKNGTARHNIHDISRAVGDHLKPLVEPGVVFTTPPHLQQAGKVGLILFFFHTKSDQESVDWPVIGFIC